jgi:hypothetical protein
METAEQPQNKEMNKKVVKNQSIDSMGSLVSYFKNILKNPFLLFSIGVIFSWIIYKYKRN